MTQQGAALQTYNNELVKSVEELKARRAALQTTIKQETEERDRLEGERARLEERLALVGTSLAERVAQGREYDRIIHEAEQVILRRGEFNNLVCCAGVLENSGVQPGAAERGAVSICGPSGRPPGGGGGPTGGGSQAGGRGADAQDHARLGLPPGQVVAWGTMSLLPKL